MCDKEEDKRSMCLFELPYSLKYALGGNQEKSNDQYENLLQIAVKDRMVIFHVGEDFNGIARKVEEVSVINATSQLMNPESFVKTGFDILKAYEDPTKDKDGYLVDQITQNSNKDICV